MKYWLIIFFFDTHGEFVNKKEVQLSSYTTCRQVEQQVLIKHTNAKTVCVTDDHHSGKKQDPGIPYD